jgi:hypothetical protein
MVIEDGDDTVLLGQRGDLYADTSECFLGYIAH